MAWVLVVVCDRAGKQEGQDEGSRERVATSSLLKHDTSVSPTHIRVEVT